MSTDLRKIVGDATPGPWQDSLGTVYPIVSDRGPIVAEMSWGVEIDPDDATFIATFDPIMVGLLLDVADAARADDYDGTWDALDRLEGHVGGR